MKMKHRPPKPAAPVTFAEWRKPEHSHKLVTRGELLFMLDHQATFLQNQRPLRRLSIWAGDLVLRYQNWVVARRRAKHDAATRT
jgi:hypothetical protein